MNRWGGAAVFALCCAAACIPKAHELEGKACSETHPCPAPLVCSANSCVIEEALDASMPVARVRELQLVDVTTRQAIYPYTPMVDGEQIPRSALPSKGVNILALTDPDIVTNVDFALFGAEKKLTTEVGNPYFLFSDKADGGINPWKPDGGSYRLQVTPFVNGEAGESVVITFDITAN